MPVLTPTITDRKKHESSFISRSRATAFSPVPTAYCLLKEIALFYAKPTSAGFLDPVTPLIPHHRPDWLYQPDFCSYGLMDGFDREGSVKCVIARPDPRILYREATSNTNH
jgi:hypothetical protein